MAPSDLTARLAIVSLVRDRWRRNFCLPNYTPADWWECDVFELTEAGFFREYEVKLTRGDFLRDAAKDRKVWATDPATGRLNTRELVSTGTKHERMAKGDERGPSRFWFVVPAGLVQLSDVPAWAGLLELTDRGSSHAPRWRWRVAEQRPAPQLHRKKLSDQVAAHARGICYYRMHALLAPG